MRWDIDDVMAQVHEILHTQRRERNGIFVIGTNGRHITCWLPPPSVQNIYQSIWVFVGYHNRALLAVYWQSEHSNGQRRKRIEITPVRCYTILQADRMSTPPNATNSTRFPSRVYTIGETTSTFMNLTAALYLHTTYPIIPTPSFSPAHSPPSTSPDTPRRSLAPPSPRDTRHTPLAWPR
jgi:hypothetical protein